MTLWGQRNTLIAIICDIFQSCDEPESVKKLQGKNNFDLVGIYAMVLFLKQYRRDVYSDSWFYNQTADDVRNTIIYEINRKRTDLSVPDLQSKNHQELVRIALYDL